MILAAESAVHGSPVSLFMCALVIVPVVWMVCKAVFSDGRPKQAEFKQPRWARLENSQRRREVSDETAGFVTTKIERFQHRG